MNRATRFRTHKLIWVNSCERKRVADQAQTSAATHTPLPFRVKNGSVGVSKFCLLYPTKQTSTVAAARSVLCPILLQKSKIERPGKSRESRFLGAPAAARLSGANTKVGGRFGMKRCGPSCRRARSASVVFKIFVLHPKKTFATISTHTGSRAF